VTCAVGFDECEFMDGIRAEGAKLKSLNITNCKLPWLHADGALVDGSLVLALGIQVSDGVQLRHAHIAGQLICSGATLKRTDDYAFDATGMVVDGDVVLDKGFEASGGVNLAGSRIGGELKCDHALFEHSVNSAGEELTNAFTGQGLSTRGPVSFVGSTVIGAVFLNSSQLGGQLRCHGATLEYADGAALVADGMTTKGDVFLDRGFQSNGTVRIVGASIGGQLVCTAARFTAPTTHDGSTPRALNAQRVTTNDSVFLDGGFEAMGEVCFASSTIGGQLNCNGARFSTPDGMALNGEFMTVRGPLIWFEMAKRPQGTLNLGRANVGSLVDDKESWPDQGQLVITDFVYASIGPDSPSSPEERLSWLRLQTSFSPQPYKQLEGYYRALGRHNDATVIAIETENAIRLEGHPNSIRRLWNWYLRSAVGYGYRPQNAILSLLAIIVIGWPLAFGAQNAGQLVETRGDAGAPGAPVVSRCTSHYPCFEPFAYAIEATIPLLNLHQAEFWTPDASKPLGILLRFYGWLATLLGWLLASTVLAGVTGLVRSS
jgi:hypothetical protein